MSSVFFFLNFSLLCSYLTSCGKLFHVHGPIDDKDPLLAALVFQIVDSK